MSGSPVYLYAMVPARPDLPVWISATTDVRRSAGHVRRGCPVDIELVGSLDLVAPITYSRICQVLKHSKMHGNWFARSLGSLRIIHFIAEGDCPGLADWLARPFSMNQ